MNKQLNQEISFPSIDNRTVSGVLALTLITATKYNSDSSKRLVEIAQKLHSENILECSKLELQELQAIVSNSNLTALEKTYVSLSLLDTDIEDDAV